jgi:hypothetical protein
MSYLNQQALGDYFYDFFYEVKTIVVGDSPGIILQYWLNLILVHLLIGKDKIIILR